MLKGNQVHPKTGNFVRFDPTEFARSDPINARDPIFGIVTGFPGGISDNGIFVDVYDHGFPIGFFVRNCFEADLGMYWGVTKEGYVCGPVKGPEYEFEIISHPKFTEHLGRAKGKLSALTKSEDLAAACWATREDYLSGIIDNILKNGKDEQHHYNIKPEFAQTGVYVLSRRDRLDEDRCNINPSKTELDGIAIDPRVSPGSASRIVTAWYGSNFRSVEGISDASGQAYFCYEIPERAVDFVKDPVKFKGPS
jgi:hypothetical protein